MASIFKLFRTSRANDRQRFTELLRPHVELMYRMACRWTGSEADAEDLVQDVLTKLATRVNEMADKEQLRPWLIKILYHRYVDTYRRARRSPIQLVHGAADETPESDCPLASASDGVQLGEQLDLRKALLDAITTLDQGQQDVLILCEVEGYTAVEVADILNISEGTVKSRLHRAKSRLKQLL